MHVPASPRRANRPHIGALLLGDYTDDGRLHYAGRAGTGITDKELKRSTPKLKVDTSGGELPVGRSTQGGKERASCGRLTDPDE